MIGSNLRMGGAPLQAAAFLAGALRPCGGSVAMHRCRAASLDSRAGGNDALRGVETMC